MFVHLDRTAGLARGVLFGLSLIACHATSVRAQDGVPGVFEPVTPHLAHIGDGMLAASLTRAVHGAARRLATERCQQVLDDFTTPSGQPLRASVASIVAEPPAALSRIIFQDGREHALCRSGGTAAFTGVGSRVVFICAQRFLALPPDEADLVVLHETMHTLGLGERPPRSAEIDRAVARRCGR